MPLTWLEGLVDLTSTRYCGRGDSSSDAAVVTALADSVRRLRGGETKPGGLLAAKVIFNRDRLP